MSSIRHQINIAAPSRTVWNVLTTAEGWTRWWANDARIDARAGGRIVLQVEDENGDAVEERGLFHELRPTRRLEIAWDANSPAATKGTRLRFTLSADGSETRLSMVHSGGGILDDDDARSQLESEWRSALHALRDSLEA